MIGAVLVFLAQDMADNPSCITAISVDLAARMAALTAGIDVDLDEEIDSAAVL